MRLFILLVSGILNIGLLNGQYSPAELPVDVDLEQMAQSYAREVKQLHIPGHSTACNPSIVHWRDMLILSFDAYSEGKEDQPDLIGLVTLDEDFNLTSLPQILDVAKNLWQDPRLITLQDRLYFPGEKADQWERNWVPFVYEDKLFLTYSLSPHRILRPFIEMQRCEEVASTPLLGSWTWGMPKPGTSAYLDGDHYLAFFHSVKVMASAHSEGKSIQHYFIGAYTFENHPPFRITAMSQAPIIGNNFYSGLEYAMIKPCRVVFRCGFVVDEEFIWLVFGRQDHEIWISKLVKNELYKEMIPLIS